MRLMAAAALAALALSACDKTEPAPTGTTGTAATGAKTGPTVSDDAIPTEEEFEDEAEQEISAQNLEAELDKLEKEITD